MFYSYTYDISLLILVILMAEKEMMIASKSLFKKRKKKRYHILKKKKKIGDLERFSRPATEIHFKCWNRACKACFQACFKQLEYRKENKISADTFTLQTPTAILTFFRLGFHTLPHISQL